MLLTETILTLSPPYLILMGLPATVLFRALQHKPAIRHKSVYNRMDLVSVPLTVRQLPIAVFTFKWRKTAASMEKEVTLHSHSTPPVVCTHSSNPAKFVIHSYLRFCSGSVPISRQPIRPPHHCYSQRSSA